MLVYFISDVHLGQDTPGSDELFLRFLQQDATEAHAIYILGDLFEVWLGDDAIPEQYQPAINALKNLTDQGTSVSLMHGNRDFLIGEYFCQITGCTLLNDPLLVEINGEPTLLMHGDSLCTDDVGYQQFRHQVRNPAWQHEFLKLSPPQRAAMARQAREQSKQHTSQKSYEIMDVNQQTVANIMQEFGVKRLIHGHTHRPDVHDFLLDGEEAQRIVLGDWHEDSAFIMRCDEDGCELIDYGP